MADLLHDRWERELDQVEQALEPWVVQTDDGPFVDLAAPEALRSLHHDLICVGYAKGWFE